jgi:HYDIN/CFA65/VesB-like, Ig-like domain
LSGTGVDMTVSLTPSSMKFAVQLVYTTSAPQLATLKNTGTQAITISSISTAKPFAENNNCPSTLQPGDSCDIHVTFTPTDRGLQHGKLTVSDNAQGSPQTVALSGTGTVVKLAPASVNFGNQKVGTKSSPRAVKLTNEGFTSLSISKITIGGTDAGDFSQTNNCGNSVPVGGSCKIEVTFAPTVTGKRSATLEVYDDGGGSPQTAKLAGTGT